MKNASRLQARSLRRLGRSIKVIAQKVEVSQSTASRWCSDIILSSRQKGVLEQKRREAGIKALAPWIRRNRNLKKKDIQTQQKLGSRDVGSVVKRDLHMIGLGLYWGEGYKRGSQEWGFTNSDALIVRAILVWLQQCYQIPTEHLSARLTINVRYKDQSELLMRRWSNETGIPLSQFAKPTFIQGYRASKLEKRTYRGTLRIKVRRGTSLRRRILSSIAEIGDQITLNSEKTFR